MSTEQHINPSAIVTKAGVGVDGPGYLAGEHPAGRTTVNGTPVSADVDVFYELDTKDWQCVASTTSQPDGTWSIVGLNPDKKFNVVARHASFGGVIAVDVQPSRTDVVALSGAFTNNEDFNGVGGFMTIESGLPPFTASVIDPLPYGLSPLVVDGRKLAIEGTSDDVGLWDSVVRVTASNGVWVDVPVQVQIQALDPHWDKVVSLLHFDGDLTDETGRIWDQLGAPIIGGDGRFGGCITFSGSPSERVTSTHQAFGTDDWTVEMGVKFNSTSGQQNFFENLNSAWTNPAGRFTIYQFNSSIRVFINSSTRINTPIPSTDTWHHLSVSCESGRVRLFVDGAIKGSWDSGGLNFDQTLTLFGAGFGTDSLYGSLDELRITKGVARYTGNFTPPDKPFPNR